MFSLGSEDHWHWGMRWSTGINFCVWSLIDDGLQVEPFTERPPGHGLLQGAGMTGVNWLSWVREILRRENVFDERPDPKVKWELVERMLDAPGAWIGPPSVTDVLLGLWARYQDEHARWGEEMNWRFVMDQEPFHRDRLGYSAGLWQELKPLHSVLQSPTIYPVDYPGTVYLPVTPRYLLIAPAAADGETGARLIREGLFALARMQEEA